MMAFYLRTQGDMASLLPAVLFLVWSYFFNKAINPKHLSCIFILCPIISAIFGSNKSISIADALNTHPVFSQKRESKVHT